MRPLPLVLLFSSLLGACGDTQTTLTLTQLPADTGPEARAVVTLYGFDELLADAAADVIGRWQLPLDASGVVVLDVPADPNTLIDQGSGPVSEADARYYFIVHVDVNGDGQLCPGDLRQDYDNTDVQFFDTVPESFSVALAPIDADRSCETIATGP